MTEIARPGIAVIAIALGFSLWLASASSVEAQKPIRIGASLSTTGTYAALAQDQLRGYQLCVKHTNGKGGLLGRKLELVVEDDRSDPSTAVRLYQKFITQDKVEAVIGPYSSLITEAVADVAEKHRMPLVAPVAATTSIYKKGRKFVFGMLPGSEGFLEGIVDLAVKKGLKTVAFIHEGTIFPRAVALGGVELAKKRGLSVVLVEAYPQGTTDFTAVLTKVRAGNPDLLAAGTYFEDALAITRQLRQLDVNPRMFAVSVGGDLPQFSETLGRSAEFVYGPSQWEAELAALRAGGLIPIARQYPGAREFVEAHRREYPGAELSFRTPAGYAGCQVLTEAVKRAGSLDGDRIRDAILKLDFNTVFGAFKVDRDGFQIAHKMVTFQWQDGKKVIVWPEELAPGKARFPTPPWSQRP
ncbi:MAG: amino acid ABC transporter substrate-binding protein [Candidatus Rokuibacteriota bacterium]